MPDRPTSHPALSLLARIFWTFFGNAALVLMLAWLASRSRGRLSAGDAVYAALALSLVAVRFLDVRFLNGETADGDRRATLADWRRHALLLTVAAGGGWLAMRALTGWF
jgi:hypothetical protein